ncbi:PREDICTED: zinc finger protein RFP-like [Gekko japonicus]|uniref:Zinc finger protein RFP-like n=1 Tax=Gekko japonicus TaxID=146911 RepID=A0ABM1K297_GEKJA|nr:PREDICTED: zinc finger protein RFP-like [Gekko japonicus]
MATGSLVKKFCEETTCSICLEYFKDPVTIDCGHNFCQACLTQYWGKSVTGPSCPQCRVFQQKNFRPNRQLANLVELVRELQVGKGAEGGRGGCERHREPLKLFCVSDQAPICMVCDRSMEHRNHRVLPMEEAFLEYKIEIQAELQSLEQERRKLQEQKRGDDQRSQNFLTQLEAEKKKTKSAFQQLHTYLEKEEHLRLSLLEEMEKEMAKRDNKTHTRFSEEVSYLSGLITEMGGKFQQSENEFLQDPKTILSRYVKKPEKKLLGPPLELEEALSTYSQETCALEDALAKCQVNVTLDLKTAHPELLVSSNMKSVTWGSNRGNFPDNPEQFDTLRSVLGHRMGEARGNGLLPPLRVATPSAFPGGWAEPAHISLGLLFAGSAWLPRSAAVPWPRLGPAGRVRMSGQWVTRPGLEGN